MLTLDYHIDTFWANLRACFYVMFHWRTRIYIENIWIERKNGDYFEGVEFVEKITFIGVVSGNLLNNDLRIHRIYYGNPRFEPENFYIKK